MQQPPLLAENSHCRRLPSRLFDLADACHMSPSRPSHTPRVGVSQDRAASAAMQEELAKRITEQRQIFDVWREEFEESHAKQMLTSNRMVGRMAGLYSRSRQGREQVEYIHIAKCSHA